jgi:hypothetical protein
MDITIIWFPLMKFGITSILIYGVYYFFKTKRKTMAVWYTVMLVAFWIFAPLKYDATNSVERNKVTQKQRTWQYKSVTSDAKEIHTVKPTFEELMIEESARSEKANKVVTDEIVK